MQKIAKRLVAAILGWQVRRLCRRHKFKVVAVAGSIGKTSTKLAIAKLLETKLRVRYQAGNYNDLVSVPLVYFGYDFPESDRLPALRNPLNWLRIILNNEKILLKAYDYDVVVVELGSDGPGQMVNFKSYVKADLGVLTAITPEHMEYFKDIDAVAKEEMTLSELSSKLLYNSELVAKEYVTVKAKAFNAQPAKDFGLKLRSPMQYYSASAAITVAQELGLSKTDIKDGLNNIQGMKGRVQFLKGISRSTIIDDSYNASPTAVKAALDTLYQFSAPQHIALLGNMNELGSYSKTAHQEVGQYCDPAKLDLVVTLGPDANRYLASAAKTKGCRVRSFDSPYAAGKFIKSRIKTGAVVLVKGSQNGVFAEEAIKSILADKADEHKLVRQSPQWLAIKKKAFNRD